MHSQSEKIMYSTAFWYVCIVTIYNIINLIGCSVGIVSKTVDIPKVSKILHTWERFFSG